MILGVFTWMASQASMAQQKESDLDSYQASLNLKPLITEFIRSNPFSMETDQSNVSSDALFFQCKELERNSRCLKTETECPNCGRINDFRMNEEWNKIMNMEDCPTYSDFEHCFYCGSPLYDSRELDNWYPKIIPLEYEY